MKAIIQITVDPLDDPGPAVVAPPHSIFIKKMTVELEGVTLAELKSALHDMGINQIWKVVDNVFDEAEKQTTKPAKILVAPETPPAVPPAPTVQPEQAAKPEQVQQPEQVNPQQNTNGDEHNDGIGKE